MSDPVLQAFDIHKSYGRGKRILPVLHGINFDLFLEDMVSIIGVSGVGKSTLLHIFGLLDAPDQGRLLLEGKEILGYNSRRTAALRNHRFGFVFQSCFLLAELNVLENVMLPGLMRGTDIRDLRDYAHRLIKRVDLEHRITHRPNELSGGEAERVAIARALINKPKILLCDEPTGNLDEETSRSVFELIRECQRIDKMAVIVVTHDDEIASSATREYRMIDGKIYPKS